MSLFGTIFIVPGVRYEADALKALDFMNMPYESHSFNAYAYPKHAPINGFVCSILLFEYPEGCRELYDIIDENGLVQAGYFDEDSVVIETFTNLEDWLTKRIQMARDEFQRYRRTQMN